MRALAALRTALARRPRTETCRACRHFANDPATLERALPGMPVFSSVHASVRADDGVCRLHGMLVNGQGACPQHAARAIKD